MNVRLRRYTCVPNLFHISSFLFLSGEKVNSSKFLAYIYIYIHIESGNRGIRKYIFSRNMGRVMGDSSFSSTNLNVAAFDARPGPGDHHHLS